MVKSNFWATLNKTQLLQDISENEKISDLFNKYKLCKSGAYYRIFKNTMRNRDIDISKFDSWKNHKTHFNIKLSPNDIFVEHSSTSAGSVKRFLIRNKEIKHECATCSNIGTWNNLPLTLQLDHINGVRNDNRIENLRWLCPNCHSQTKTYAGRNYKKSHRCPTCGASKNKKSKTCRKCLGFSRRKPLPDKTILELKVWGCTMQKLSKELGISYVKLKKRCRELGVITPTQGYWNKRKSGKTHEEALLPIPAKEKSNRLTSDQVAQIVALKDSGKKWRFIGRQLGLAHTTVLRAYARNKPGHGGN